MPLVLSVAEKGQPPTPVRSEAAELTVGRDDENDVVLPKGNVSKRHARVVEREGKVILVDLKSTNGTFVNGKRITGPQVIHHGDDVAIGDYTLRLGEPDDEASREEPEVPEQLEWIVTLDGPEGRQQFALLGDVTVGRSSACDIPVIHKNVGRRQLRILPFSRYVAVTDLGTTLGTWLNGERLTGTSRLSSSDDVLEFAAHRLWVHRPGEEPPTARGKPGAGPGPGWKLLLQGLGSPELIPIEHEPIEAGSHPECRIVITAPGTPERALRFVLTDDEGLEVTVLGETQAGIWCGEDRLAPEAAFALSPGDQLKVCRGVSIAVQTSRPLRPPPPRPEVTVPRMRVPRPRGSGSSSPEASRGGRRRS